MTAPRPSFSLISPSSVHSCGRTSPSFVLVTTSERDVALFVRYELCDKSDILAPQTLHADGGPDTAAERLRKPLIVKGSRMMRADELHQAAARRARRGKHAVCKRLKRLAP